MSSRTKQGLQRTEEDGANSGWKSEWLRGQCTHTAGSSRQCTRGYSRSSRSPSCATQHNTIKTEHNTGPLLPGCWSYITVAPALVQLMGSTWGMCDGVYFCSLVSSSVSTVFVIGRLNPALKCRVKVVFVTSLPDVTNPLYFWKRKFLAFSCSHAAVQQ